MRTRVFTQSYPLKLYAYTSLLSRKDLTEWNMFTNLDIHTCAALGCHLIHHLGSKWRKAFILTIAWSKLTGNWHPGTCSIAKQSEILHIDSGDFFNCEKQQHSRPQFNKNCKLTVILKRYLDDNPIKSRQNLAETVLKLRRAKLIKKYNVSNCFTFLGVQADATIYLKHSGKLKLNQTKVS